MARYGYDVDRHRMGMHDFTEQRGRAGRGSYRIGGQGDASRTGGMIGGMRSDAGDTRSDRFPGEEGWFGEGYAGYPGGDPRGGARGSLSEMRGGGLPDLAFGGGREERGYDAGYGDAGQRGGQGRGRGAAYRVRAREIMTTDPVCVTPDTPVRDVARRMRDLDVGIIPVVESDTNRRLRGVVTDRDLALRVLAAGRGPDDKVSEVMTEQVEMVNQNDTVHRILDVMKREQVRRVPVTDREGRLVGVVAQADLAVRYAGLDLQRETEVEEAIERISEPARPRR
jgi:CBS domain-containing protein